MCQSCHLRATASIKLKYTPEELNSHTEAQQNLDLAESAVSPAVTSAITSTDAEQLAELVRRWPTLSDAMRNAILMIACDASRST